MKSTYSQNHLYGLIIVSEGQSHEARVKVLQQEHLKDHIFINKQGREREREKTGGEGRERGEGKGEGERERQRSEIQRGIQRNRETDKNTKRDRDREHQKQFASFETSNPAFRDILTPSKPSNFSNQNSIPQIFPK